VIPFLGIETVLSFSTCDFRDARPALLGPDQDQQNIEGKKAAFKAALPDTQSIYPRHLPKASTQGIYPRHLPKASTQGIAAASAYRKAHNSARLAAQATANATDSVV
jgi:hypothetical protein